MSASADIHITYRLCVVLSLAAYNVAIDLALTSLLTFDTKP